jgi:hypothetical protein
MFYRKLFSISHSAMYRSTHVQLGGFFGDGVIMVSRVGIAKTRRDKGASRGCKEMWNVQRIVVRHGTTSQDRSIRSLIFTVPPFAFTLLEPDFQ